MENDQRTGAGGNREGIDQRIPVNPGMSSSARRRNSNGDPEFCEFDGTCTEDVFQVAG